MNYLIGDIVIRLKNAVRARRRSVAFPYANTTKAIAEVLKREKYITSFKEEIIDGKKMIVAEIAFANRLPLFTDVKIISKPSLRVYGTVNEVLQRGLGMTVISTNKGIMTGKEAKDNGVGGEILFKIW